MVAQRELTHSKHTTMTMTRTAAVSKLTFPSYLEKEFDAILDSRQDLKIFSVIDVKLSALISHSVTNVYLTDEGTRSWFQNVDKAILIAFLLLSTSYANGPLLFSAWLLVQSPRP